MNETKLKIRGEQVGLYKMVEGFGSVIGPIIGGLLLNAVSITAPFIVSGLIGICGALVYRTLKNK